MKSTEQVPAPSAPDATTPTTTTAHAITVAEHAEAALQHIQQIRTWRETIPHFVGPRGGVRPSLFPPPSC